MTWETQLKTLVPKKFRDSQRMLDYVESIGEWLDDYPQGKLEDLLALIDVRRVPTEYLPYLADIIGLSLSLFLGSEDSQLRRQVGNAVDWYKIKGTYRAVTVILYSVELNATVYDLYTLDYETFIRMYWFSLGVNNPVDYEVFAGSWVDGMYKTPHFDIQVELDRYFGTSPTWYLITGDQFTTARLLIEEVRPVNTIPHYYARIVGSASSDFLVNTIAGSGVSMVVIEANWQAVTYTLDDPNGIRYMDQGNILDFTVSGFLQSWSKFKLGIGNVGQLPSTSATDLDDSVYTGNVANIQVTSNSVTFTIDVPEAYVKNGITEIGLFDASFSTMYVLATHPTVNKVGGYILRYELTVNF